MTVRELYEAMNRLLTIENSNHQIVIELEENEMYCGIDVPTFVRLQTDKGMIIAIRTTVLAEKEK